MRRRTFLELVATTSVAGSAFGRTGGTTRATSLTVGTSCAPTDTISPLEFYSPASLLDANGGTLTDSSVVVTWAADTATNDDADRNNDAVLYGSTPIPLAADDGPVVGFGAMLVQDNQNVNFEYGNEEFVLNVWDAKLGGSGTVLWDDGHGQYYTLSSFTEFESYAEANGYTVQATTSLAADLSSADAAVVTSPSTAFTSNELDALASFVSGGGALFLHDQSDYGDNDETANLNAIASHLGLAFRFNDDEVTDTERNYDGNDYAPVTDAFNDATFDYFTDRTGLGFEAGNVYTATVSGVTDGDTVDVDFPDGTTEEIRMLGMDTPETKRNSKYERIQEWEGIEDDRYLSNWGETAKDYAKSQLDGETVSVIFDENEPVRDAYGRLLAYVHYDRTGDGSRDTDYNYEMVAQGYARVYDSGLTRHESYWDAEQNARQNGTGVWTQSDPANSTEIRDRSVDDLFFPNVSSIRTTTGAVADSRVPVYAEGTATQDANGGVSYTDIPLVALDEAANVAMVGGPTIDEAYEADEGFGVDTSGYENFAFLTNLIDYLSDTTGSVLIDGGHGQFGAEFALSSEDAAYYQRYLEGQGIAFEQVNTLSSANLSRGRAIVITTPPTCFTQTEVDALSTFVGDGGAVVLVGSAAADAGATANLNDLAGALGSDLRLNDDQVLDATNNVDGDSSIVSTTVFDASFPLFTPYS